MNSKKRSGQTRSEGTRARVLDAAQRLFNEQGTAAVSTNRIAEEAGLSPGNLYYHFQDKKQIIRELHGRYSAGFDDHYTTGASGVDDLTRLWRNLAAGVRWTWDYRFFAREILALLRADQQLREQYLAVRRRRLDEWSALAERLVAQGMLRQPEDPAVLPRLTLAIWLLAESWLTFLDATGDGQDPLLGAEAADLVRVVIEPYLTAAGKRALSASGEADGGEIGGGVTGGAEISSGKVGFGEAGGGEIGGGEIGSGAGDHGEIGSARAGFGDGGGEAGR